MKEENLDINNILTLEDCIEFLIDMSEKDNIKEWAGKNENFALVNAHHNVGRALRNKLKLWHDGPLVKWFNNIGIYHADDMSSIILVSTHRKLNGKEINLEEQVKEYRDYWENANSKMK